jgi:DNA-binding response OmpR family regulator
MVDDAHDLLDIIPFILKDNGYEIRTLTNGEGIFEVIRQFNPNLALMVARLPFQVSSALKPINRLFLR